ncbi:MAG TPA: zf-HC2 domain-containing protein [Acidimicrobiales bacterium]|jgi:predicted anti-sigma-YlaC factor YlaD|nr:zf-HC2 domain-containing protein [Acidimicrobiales bacterium]
MDCTQWRELLSARLDGEVTDLETLAVDQHLTGCAACRQFDQHLARLARETRLRPAEPVPDLTGEILRAVVPRQRSFRESARWLLAWVAGCQLVLAVPALVLGDDRGASMHVARHIGSFDIAIATALLAAAWKPVRAAALLPLAGALTSCLLASTILDLADGSTTAPLEAHHLIDLVGFALLWLVAGSPRPRWARLA